MTAPEGDVFVDTNVLLAATDTSRAHHRRARAILDEWPRGAVLMTSGQVLREYYVVCTRPTSANGLGMVPGEALSNIGVIEGRLMLLDDRTGHHSLWRDLVTRFGLTGAAAHDASIVATMLNNRVRRIATFDAGAFSRMAADGTIQLIPL